MTSKRTAVTLVLAILLTLTALGCHRAAHHPPTPAGDEMIARVEQSLMGPVRVAGEPGRTLEERLAYYDVPGVSVAVIHDFELAWARAYGVADREAGTPVTPETLFQAASISKPVTAAAALRAVEQGALDLDQPINDVLRSWQLPANDLTAQNPVTLRRLLSHTAGTTVHGFPGYAVDDELPTLTQVLDGEPPANTAPIRVDVPPGSRWRYSGGGTTIVQQALIDLRQQPFPQLMRETVLEAMGMTASTYEQPLPPERLPSAAAGHRTDGRPVRGKRHTYPEMAAAGLWTTPSDLARFAIALQRSLRGDPGTVLSQDTVTEMLTPVVDNAGLGLFLDQRGEATYFQHGGANEGFRATLVAHRDAGYGAAVTCNSDNGRVLAEIVRAVALVYGWQDFLPEPLEPIAVPPEELAAYAGRYRVADDRIYAVSREGDRLIGRSALQTEDPAWLVPVAADTFVSHEDGFRFLFQRDEGGRVTGYVNAEGGEDDPRVRPRLADDESEPVELLAAGRTAEAIAAYRALGAAEDRINRLGYELLRAGRTEQAIAVFELNTDLYLDSANTWDSLADAFLAQEDHARAAAAFRQVLATLPRDKTADPEAREQLRARAEAQLARLAE